MEYKVYIIESIVDKHYYIGCTTNTQRRLDEHNCGSNRSTRKYKPWRLIYSENYLDKSAAYKREWHLKHPKGYIEKLNIIRKYGEVA